MCSDGMMINGEEAIGHQILASQKIILRLTHCGKKDERPIGLSKPIGHSLADLLFDDILHSLYFTSGTF